MRAIKREATTGVKTDSPQRWGVTDAEVALTLPGDELIAQPLVRWTHVITINAPPAAVWPWIAQLGDTRGGYYSYTFIENQVSALTGAQDYNVVYTNADRIHPEWQNPQPGDAMIQSVLKVREVAPEHYLLADSVDPSVMNWVWLWQIEPAANGQETRLLVRMAISTAGPSNPVTGFMMDVGGFVMEQNMLQGIQARAEGGFEPSWTEPVEIALWTMALLIGLVGAFLFVARSPWMAPLALAVVAVMALFGLTFVQPALWLRTLIDVALLLGMIWAWRVSAPGASTSPQAQHWEMRWKGA
ncbi:MAG: hypothetical protein KDE54_27965 [Caldilineaceae bacterium]|nr:hypothetical protein [Caldilineaceae bacterium]MCB0098614.1 hypothetical protein [Caldilineaceae bacterium]MCB0142858.1 hypothetical protein [Caldilineaceae bacterium]